MRDTMKLLIAVVAAGFLAVETNLSAQPPLPVAAEEAGVSPEFLQAIKEHLATGTSPWERVAGTLGSMSFLAWYCWHVTSKVLPAKDKQLLDAQAGYASEAKENRSQAFAEADSARAHNAAMLDKILAEHRSSVDKMQAMVLEVVSHCKAQQGARLESS